MSSYIQNKKGAIINPFLFISYFFYPKSIIRHVAYHGRNRLQIGILFS